MRLATVDSNTSQQDSFEKYFKNTDLFELFQFSPETCNTTCETLEMLTKEGFPYEKTPTNVKHIEGYLKSIPDLVKGISLNSNLYTNKDAKEEVEPVIEEEVESERETA